VEFDDLGGDLAVGGIDRGKVLEEDAFCLWCVVSVMPQKVF